MGGMMIVLKYIGLGLEALGTLAVAGALVYLSFRAYVAFQPAKKSDIQTLFPKK
jgi:hypothetical protein